MTRKISEEIDIVLHRSAMPTSVVSMEKLLSYFVRLNGPLTLLVRLVALSRRAVILVASLVPVSSLVSPFRLAP